jgi:hypothetical protein
MSVDATCDYSLLDFEWADRESLTSPPIADLWRSVDGLRGRAFRAEADVPGWRPLVCLQSLQGASFGAIATWHYTVETDVAAERERDFNAWYEQEHLPGLARVVGTVRAQRFARQIGTPKYLACYDLTDPAALERPEWLAVRATAWSSRIRPLFVNPRRTMFRRADLWQAVGQA